MNEGNQFNDIISKYMKLGLIPFSATIDWDNNKQKKETKFNYKWSNVTKNNCHKYIDANKNALCLLVGKEIKKDYHLIVVDIDNKPNTETELNGLDKWNQLTYIYGDIQTPKVRTGHGGLHYYVTVHKSIINNLPAKKTKMIIDDKTYGIDLLIKDQFIYAPPSNYMADGKSLSYKWIDEPWNMKFMECPKWLVNIILDNTKKNILKQKDKNMVVDKNIVIDKPIVKISNIELKELDSLLDMIRHDIWDNRDDWIRIGLIIFNMGGSFELWCKYAQKSSKFDINDSCKQWNSFKSNNSKIVTKASLLEKKADGKYKYIDDDLFKKYVFNQSYREYTPISKDLINKLQLKYIETPPTEKYVTLAEPIKATDNKTYDMKDYETILVIAPTGSGKTSNTAKYVYKYDMNDDKKVVRLICPTSRITVAHQVINSFAESGIIVDDYDKVNINKSTSLAIELESIKKLIKRDWSSYTVYIDEIDSLIISMLTSSTHNGIRKIVFDKLMTIVKNCKRLIVTDADMSDITIQYISKLRNMEKAILLKNNYIEPEKKKAVQYNNENEILNKIINTISAKGDGFAVCCDTLSRVDSLRLLVMGTEEYKKNPSKFLFYTSQLGNRYIHDASKEWKDKYVFYSPSIIYGVNFVPKNNQDVYVFVDSKILTCCQIVQQVTRTRKIRSLYYFLSEVSQSETKLKYNSIEDVINDINTKINQYNKIYKHNAQYNDMATTILMNVMTEMDSVTVNKNMEQIVDLENLFSELYCMNILRNDTLMSNFGYHFKLQLIAKGFEISSIGVKKYISSKDKTNTKKNIKENNVLAIKNMLENVFDNDNFIGDKYHKTLYDLCNYVGIQISDINKYEFLLDKTSRNDYFGTISLMNNNAITMDKLKKDKENDFDIINAKTTNVAIKLCIDIEKILNIQRLDINNNNHMGKYNNPIVCESTIVKSYAQIMNSKTTPVVDIWKDLYKMLINLYRHIAGNKIVITKKRVYKDKNKHTVNEYLYNINVGYMKLCLELYKTKNPKLANIQGHILVLCNIKPQVIIHNKYMFDDIYDSIYYEKEINNMHGTYNEIKKKLEYFENIKMLKSVEEVINEYNSNKRITKIQ